jgi:predicted Zn finger-like uncharacterized protein
MSVEPRCPSCHAACPITDDDIGKKVRCEKCEHVFTVKARTLDPEEDEDGTSASPWMQDAEVARRKGHAEQTGEAAKRTGKKDDEEADRDDDPAGKDPPRSRRSRERDEDDDPPARRGGSVARKKSGGRLGLVLALAGAAAVLLLLCGGVAVWLAWAKFSDNPKVTVGNFERVQPNVPLADVEAFFGGGRACTGADVAALLNNPQLKLGNAHVKAVAGNSQQFGITRWCRWTNGPTTMFVGVDAAGKVRVAGLVTITPHRTESYFKLNV